MLGRLGLDLGLDLGLGFDFDFDVDLNLQVTDLRPTGTRYFPGAPRTPYVCA